MTDQRVTTAAATRLVGQLGARDEAILLDLARVRLLSGAQLTRLHFHSLSLKTRERVRRRSLSRLVELRLVTTLERQIGGVRAGSAGLVYSLSAGGWRTLGLLDNTMGMEAPKRPRKPWTPSQLFLQHSLDISELYVQLVEAVRTNILRLTLFRTEPASWFTNGANGVIKPDAYVAVSNIAVSDYWAVEVDRATESLPTIRRKLLAYVDFALSGQITSDDVTPRVLVTVPHAKRYTAVSDVIMGLPEPAAQLIRVVRFSDAIQTLIEVLLE